MKTIIGIIVTTIVLYFWGYLYWNISDLPGEILQQTPNDEQAQAALKEHFPETGAYFVPGFQHEAEEMARLSATGPSGFIHITHEPGTEIETLISGFVLILVVVALLALLFRVANATEFRDFVRLSIVAGLVAVVAIDGGNMIWFQYPVGWTVLQGIYDFTVWLIAGHMLGIFMKRNPAGAGS